MTENTCCIITSCVMDAASHINFHLCIHGPYSYSTVCFICFQYSVWDSLRFLLIIFFTSYVYWVLDLKLDYNFVFSLFFFQAGLVTTLSTRTIVFGATNPKGQYDPDQCITSIASINQNQFVSIRKRKKEEYINQFLVTGCLSLFTLSPVLLDIVWNVKLNFSFLNLYFS